MAKDPESEDLNKADVVEEDEELDDLNGGSEDEVADIGDTVLTAIEKDFEASEPRALPNSPVAQENARRRVEDYLEMKRAAKELHDLDDFDYDVD